MTTRSSLRSKVCALGAAMAILMAASAPEAQTTPAQPSGADAAAAPTDGAGKTRIEVYPLKEMRAETAARLLSRYFGKGDDAPSRLHVDEKSNAVLIVGPNETQRRVAELLQTVDVPPEEATPQHTPRERASATPEPRDDVARVYRLEHVGANTVFQVARTVVPEAQMAMRGDGAVVVVAPPYVHERVAALLEALDVAFEPEEPDQLKVFRLIHTDVKNAAKIISELSDRRRIKVSTDPRTNSLVASGPARDLEVIEALLLRLDEGDARQRPAPGPTTTFRVRVVWLATGLTDDDLPAPADDLEQLLAELSKLGVSDPRQVAEIAVDTLPHGTFKVRYRATFDRSPVDLDVSGQLDDRDGTFRLAIQVSAEQATARPGQGDDAAAGATERRGLVRLQTEVAAPHGHYVVLGVGPVGKTTSVFAVRVAPRESVHATP